MVFDPIREIGRRSKGLRRRKDPAPTGAITAGVRQVRGQATTTAAGSARFVTGLRRLSAGQHEIYPAALRLT